MLRPVSIVGIAQLPVLKRHESSLRAMGAVVVRQAMAAAGVEQVDALYAGNMLSDELQGQKHLASLIADEAGLAGVEALQVRAATATGAAALRFAHLAVASGQVNLAVAVGVEKMSDADPTAALAKSLDAVLEVPAGATMISQNARLMQLYLERYGLPPEALACFSVNAHRNALTNPYARFHNPISVAEVMASRPVSPPIRLFDCSPICDGAAAVVLAPKAEARHYSPAPVDILAARVATDRFRLADREDPLRVMAARLSALRAYAQAGITPADVDLFELHDAFSIMACLLLEAAGFAPPGEGWRLAESGEIGPRGKVPVATMGGLKARGHPIGATALYQACELVQQLTGQAGPNQVPGARVGMMQSVGGVAATVLTHILSVPAGAG